MRKPVVADELAVVYLVEVELVFGEFEVVEFVAMVESVQMVQLALLQVS